MPRRALYLLGTMRDPDPDPEPIPDDETVSRWIVGTPEERARVLEAAWRHYSRQLVGLLKNSFPSLAWEDCEDLAGDAFAVLQGKLAGGEFRGDDLSRTFHYLRRVAYSLGIDFVKNRERRGRKEEELAMREEWRAPEDYCAWVVRMEFEAIKRSYGEMVTGKLIECARQMKPGQRAVAVIMVDTFVTCARWPTNERLLELMCEKEPNLLMNTLVERRKEVLAKFRPILHGHNIDDLW